jgi:hypothetical protein
LAKRQSSEPDIICPFEGTLSKPGVLPKGFKSAAVGNVVGPHYGGLNKRNFTWSIVRNYTGYTPDNISDNDVELLLGMALATWASVANISFTKVSSGGEITFEWAQNLTSYGVWQSGAGAVALSKDENGTPLPAVLYEAYGAQIVFADEPYLANKNINWAVPNAILTTAIHELGHFLGMWHANMDTAYGNSQPCHECQCTNCTYPKLNDPSIMSYDNLCDQNHCAGYLSEYDVVVIETKYGPNAYGRPFLELWIPSWNKHFYTASWEEANPLVFSGFASDINWFWGMIYNNQSSGMTPLHRHFTTESGVGPKHYYSTGTRLYSPTPMSYEGIMGYIVAPGEDEGDYAQRLYNHYLSYNHDNQLTSSSTPPGGYSYQNIFGHVVPFYNLPAADE